MEVSCNFWEAYACSIGGYVGSEEVADGCADDRGIPGEDEY